MGADAFEDEYAAGRALGLAQVLDALDRADAADGQAPVTGPDEAGTVLTPRELDILKLVAQGLSNPDIAQRLYLSTHTVRRGCQCRSRAVAPGTWPTADRQPTLAR